MTDITERLRKWSISTDAVPASDLMDEAAREIEWLRQNRNDTPSQQLLAAYQLGVSHRHPPDQVRNGAVESRETVQLTDSAREATAQLVAQTATSCGLTDAEREAIWFFAAIDSNDPVLGSHAATLRALLERLK